MAPVMKSDRILLQAIVAASLAAGGVAAFAGDGRMSPEERQRLRDDMNSARRDVYRGGPPPQAPQGRPQHQPHRSDRMSPEEREKLRRDMNDANRGMNRR